MNKDYAQAIKQWLNSALMYHQNGDLQNARLLYEKILSVCPKHADALHLSGVIALQENNAQKGIKRIEKALQTDPNNAAYHSNLGNAYKLAGQLKEAKTHYHKALRIAPDMADAQCNLAGLLLEQGQTKKALSLCKKVIAKQSNHSEALYNLGLAYETLQQYTDAINAYQQCLSLAPNMAKAHSNCGNCYRALGQIDLCIAHYNKAIALDSNLAQTHYNMGYTLLEIGQSAASINHFIRALDCGLQACKIYYNLGMAYQKQQQHDKALEWLTRAVAHDAQDMCAVAMLIQGKRAVADWVGLAAFVARFKAQVENYLQHCSDLGIAHYATLHLCHDEAQIHRIVRKTTQLLTGHMQARFKHTRKCQKTIKVGYVSPDFHEHCVGLLLNRLFDYHDRSRFEIHAYDLHKVNDEMQRSLATSFDHYHDLTHLDYRQCADKIYHDGIDILIDLAGQTARARPAIFAQQPAPIQCHFVGDTGTLGADYIQYYISHKAEVPTQSQAHFSEKLVYLPETVYAMCGFKNPITPLSREEYGLSREAFVFCCFNKIDRIEPNVFHAWMMILKYVRKSQLWLQIKDQQALARLLRTAEMHGIASHRIVNTKPHYLTDTYHHRLADLYLDTFILSGGTTAFLSYWVGLPVLTLSGSSPQSRFGAAIAHGANCQTMIVNDIGEYIQKAVFYAKNKAILQDLKSQLHAKRAAMPIFKAKQYIHYLEQAYEQMIDNYQKRQVKTITIVKETASKACK